MTESKRDSKGRFKGKTKTPKKPVNPDCEPATKGYVKCIGRMSTDHQHNQRMCGDAPLAAALLLSLGWAIAIGIRESTLAWIFGVGALMMFAVIVDLIMVNDKMTSTSNIDGSPCTDYVYPTYLRRYKLPTCEKKNECE